MNTIEVMRKALEALNRLYLAAPTSLECRTFHHSKSEQHRHDEECKPAMEYVQAVGASANAIIALRAELERLEAVEPVAWSISHDGKTPYMLWESGDGALLDLEVKRVGGTACKLALYAAPVAPTIPALRREAAL